MDSVRPCGPLMLHFPTLVTLTVNSRNGIMLMSGSTNAGYLGCWNTILVQCLLLWLFRLVMVTTNVFSSPILLTLDCIPVRSMLWLCLSGTTNIISLFLLISVTGLRSFVR